MGNIEPMKGLKPVKKRNYVFSKDLEEFTSLLGDSFQAGSKTLSTSKDNTYIHCDSHENILGKHFKSIIITDKFIKTRPKETRTILYICSLNQNNINGVKSEIEIERLVKDGLIDPL